METIEQTLLANHGNINSIIRFFRNTGISAQDGEFICLWIAGVSMGLRQKSLVDKDVMEVIATSWQLAVANGEM